jgi:hypothetical protein
VAETASAQVTAAVQAALVPAARYIALVTQANPLGTAAHLLARPDIDASLAAALEQARAEVTEIVQQEWAAAGAPAAPVLAHLLADVARQYGSLSHLRSLIRQAHASVPQRRFIRGVTPPGASPAIAAGNERARAVRDAILGFARQASLRSRLTVSVAGQAAKVAVVLAEGRARAAAGEKVRKQWLARLDGKACHWCRSLHGVTIGMDESFLPYLGGPADLTGHGRLTQPPKPYHGELQGPPLHPRCRCRLMVVTEVPPKPVQEPPAPPSAPFIAAAQIRAMPESKYKSLIAFLQAAVHELGQVLGRLVQAVR